MIIKKKTSINVEGLDIRIITNKEGDYISLTDMIKAKDGDFFISDWLRNRNTVEFLGVWESINNPGFNYGEFAIIKNHVGLNNYKISVQELVNKANIISLKAKTGKYGGTFAHKDIAFEFGMWISPRFKLYLIKEFQRLKEAENSSLSLGWNINRVLTKLNYKIHTDAIKEHIIPASITKEQESFIYADEADILNVALFGKTARQWRLENKGKEGNIRDYASIEQLLVLANMESVNAEFIRMKMTQGERLRKLNQTAITQIRSLVGMDVEEKLKIAQK